MKASDIRKMTTEEIDKKITQLKKELFEKRLSQATGNLDKPHQINELRKTIARLKTVLTEKEGVETNGKD